MDLKKKVPIVECHYGRHLIESFKELYPIKFQPHEWRGHKFTILGYDYIHSLLSHRLIPIKWMSILNFIGKYWFFIIHSAVSIEVKRVSSNPHLLFQKKSSRLWILSLCFVVLNEVKKTLVLISSLCRFE